MNNTEKDKITRFLKDNNIPNAIKLLEELRSSDNSEELLLLLAELYYNSGNLIKSLNCYNALHKFYPGNQIAINYISIIKSIIDYSYKESFNV